MSSSSEKKEITFLKARRVLEDALREEFDVAKVYATAAGDETFDIADAVMFWIEEHDNVAGVSAFWRSKEALNDLDLFSLAHYLRIAREHAFLFRENGYDRIASMLQLMSEGKI